MYRASRRPLVPGRDSFDVVDHHNFDRQFFRLQLQTQLLLQRREDRRSVRGLFRRLGAQFFPGKMQIDIEDALGSRLIDDRKVQQAREELGQPVDRYFRARESVSRGIRIALAGLDLLDL